MDPLDYKPLNIGVKLNTFKHEFEGVLTGLPNNTSKGLPIISNDCISIELITDRIKIKFKFGKRNEVDVPLTVLHDALNDYLEAQTK